MLQAYTIISYAEVVSVLIFWCEKNPAMLNKFILIWILDIILEKKNSILIPIAHVNMKGENFAYITMQDYMLPLFIKINRLKKYLYTLGCTL